MNSLRCPRCGAGLDLVLMLACSEGIAEPAQREADALVAAMRAVIAGSRPRKPGMGELVTHLCDHVGLLPEGALVMLGALGAPLDREGARAALKNGRRRHLRQHFPCRFCGP